MKSTFPGRSFQFWEYRVSHGQVLLRSPKGLDVPKNIDIMFAGVEYVDLPRHLSQLEIEEATDVDLAFAQERLGKAVPAQDVTVLKCGNRRHIVVAAAVKVRETEMEIFDNPFP